MTAPDLTPARQHAEAVAYGKQAAVRQILDALAADRPNVNFNSDDVFRGYDRAVSVVKATRLGVEHTEAAS